MAPLIWSHVPFNGTCDKALPRETAYAGTQRIGNTIVRQGTAGPRDVPSHPPSPQWRPLAIKHCGPLPSLLHATRSPTHTLLTTTHPRLALPHHPPPTDLLPPAPRSYFSVINFRKLLLICHWKFSTTCSHLSTHVNKSGI